jgi:hypothetical protein
MSMWLGLFISPLCLSVSMLWWFLIFSHVSFLSHPYLVFDSTQYELLIFTDLLHGAEFLLGTRKFITVFTSARHLSLFWASSIQSIPPHPTSWISILILSTHLRLGLPSGLIPSRFPTKILCTPFPIRPTCPAPLILLDFITRTVLGEKYRPLSFLLLIIIIIIMHIVYCLTDTI